MKDNRDKQMAQLAGWTWDLNGYAGKVPFYNADDLTMREVRSAFQLEPEPPQMELSDYMREAVRKRDLSYFSFFLHCIYLFPFLRILFKWQNSLCNNQLP